MRTCCGYSCGRIQSSPILSALTDTILLLILLHTRTTVTSMTLHSILMVQAAEVFRSNSPQDTFRLQDRNDQERRQQPLRPGRLRRE